MSEIKEIYKKKIVPITFERTVGLFGATTIGVGALMGAGVYVLIGLAADVAGPSVWLSYAICGGLAFLTAFLFAELARKNPASGGAYGYVYNSLGSLEGFVTGWFLALGSVFACGLYAIGFAEYFASVLGYDFPNYGIKLIAIILVLASTALNTRGTKSGEKVQKFLTWGNVFILVILIGCSVFALNIDNLTPMYPNGFKGTGAAIAIIYISFFGFQLIANNSDEIKEPSETVPKAMILSLGISLLLYILITLTAILVIPWQELASSNAPLLLVATKSLGGFGWVLISSGALIASAGALNSTLLSQGRQIFAMGKSQFLPKILGKIHEARKTPQAALYAGGFLIIIVLLFLDLEFIAKSANFCLLVSMLPASLALRKIYKTEPEKRPKLLLKRLLPEISLIVNIALLFTLDWVSLTFGFQLLIIGGLVYFFYSRKREVRGKIGMNLVLSASKKRLLLGKQIRVLVPVANPSTLKAICTVSNSLLSQSGGELVTLSVVKTSDQIDFYAALAEADYALDIIQKTANIKVGPNVQLTPVIRASKSIPQGIVHAAEEEGCDLIVMGYEGKNSQKTANIINEMLHHANTNVVFLKFRNLEATFPPKKIAVSVGSSLNLELITRLGSCLAKSFGGQITFLTIIPTNAKEEQKKQQEKLLNNIKVQQRGNTSTFEMISSDNALETLIEKSSEFDLLIVGTSKVKLLERAVVGHFSTQLAERAACSIAVVRTVTTAKKLINSVY
ncbi:amino acid permease [Flexithrix dorotheae]|uniref:amino acid permease n=1 Tax=Flexithrix dorotheae TaxID=70993 RepID=UPI00037B221A|nr:amino acid permease [Flexithrix dorotheae]